MAKGYIYIIKCPITDIVAYVGQSHDPEFRFNQHRKSISSPIGKWIRAMDSIGWHPIFDIIDCTEIGINALEKKYIKLYSERGEAIHNKTFNVLQQTCRFINPIINKKDNCPSVRAKKRQLLNEVKNLITYSKDTLIDELSIYAVNKIYSLITNEKNN